MADFEDDLKKDFLDESRELLKSAERAFLSLEKGEDRDQTLNSLLRLAHNFKGGSQFVGLNSLSEFSHRLESLLIAIKSDQLSLNPYVIDLLFRANDYLTQTIEALHQDINSQYENTVLMQELVTAVDSADKTNLANVANRSSHSNEAESYQMPTLAVKASAKLSADRESSIRVNLERIEKLLNCVGELSILQAVMVQEGKALGASTPPLMRETISSMTKIIKETQNISMGLRMLPVKQTFHKMERIVRDISKSLGKSIEFESIGEETEIDKTVLEQLADPLVHLVRNAIDHGIEAADTRRAAGKPEIGRVVLSAQHKSGQILIEVRDDGSGLDPEKLIAKAKAKGLISKDKSLSAEEAYQLIFAPGFSTKDQATDVSGRGVGMDVVKTNVTAMQGNIEIETELGKGSTFRIYLPLTMAIIESIVVKSCNDRFIVPLAQVSEFFRPERGNLKLPLEKEEILTLRDETMNTMRLSTLLGRSNGDRSEPNTWNLTALIVRDQLNQPTAIFVDRILTRQQVVIKPLSAEIRGQVGVIGAAILGDGKPALILDLNELIRDAQKRYKLNENIKRNYLGVS